MSILNLNNSVILMIDVQERLLNAVYNKEFVEKKVSALVQAAKILGIPLIATEQYPKGLGETVQTVKDLMPDDSHIFEKTSFSALDSEEVFDALKAVDKNEVILFGIETHICVNQTANTLIELGYDVSVVSDASSSRLIDEHEAGLGRIKEHGAHILTTETILFEWLRTSKHPMFKEIQALIK